MSLDLEYKDLNYPNSEYKIKITKNFCRIYMVDDDYATVQTQFGELKDNIILWSFKAAPKVSEEVMKYCEKIVKNKAFL